MLQCIAPSLGIMMHHDSTGPMSGPAPASRFQLSSFRIRRVAKARKNGFGCTSANSQGVKSHEIILEDADNLVASCLV